MITLQITPRRNRAAGLPLPTIFTLENPDPQYKTSDPLSSRGQRFIIDWPN